MKHYVSKFIHKDHNEIFYIKQESYSRQYWTAEVVKPDGYRSKITLSPHNLKQFENTLREKGFISV